MKFKLFSVFLLIAFAGKAQSFADKYTAYTIADSLTKSATVVVRENEIKFRVKDIDRAVLEVHNIITILNEKGSDYLSFSATSDKFNHLDDAEIKVYNALGTKLNTYSKKEMQNFSYGEGLVEDGKVTYFTVSAATYPITVEMTYSIKYSGLLEYPDRYLQRSDESVEHFLYSVEIPKTLGIRYRVLNSKVVPTITENGDNSIYTWDVRNMVAKKREKSSGPVERYFPQIVLAPNKFKLAGFEGNMSTWKDFGMWNYNLIGTGNKLSDKSSEIIRELVKDKKTDREKAAAVYKYLQANMRYVSVQLGIGGWKPFEANFVQDKKYGDCKALSNYMQAALNVAGVKSYYAIVNAGTNGMPAMEDFPSSKFDHVILCIPQEKDSIWLECTSNTTDFNELGDFTENRKALLITEAGGFLVSTPKSRSSANVFNCSTSVNINDDGTGKMHTVFSGTGEFKQEQVHYFNERSKDEQIKYIVKALDWKQPDALLISCGNRFETPYKTNVDMAYEQLYVFKAGNKMFFAPRYYSFFDEEIVDDNDRKMDYFFSGPYIKNDSTSFVLPDGFIPENLPKNTLVKSSFGRYESTYKWDEISHKACVYATLEISQPRISAKDYKELMNFKRQVDADLSQRIVIRQK